MWAMTSLTVLAVWPQWERGRLQYCQSDPNGLSWETFFTMGETTVYGEDLRPVTEAKTVAPATACCAKTSA